MNNSGLDFFQILDMLEEATLSNVKPTLFLSYCSTDECIADIIEKALNSETDSRITISRYTRLPYKQSFKQFMESIPEHDFMLCIVSDSYLKSQACMYEIGEIIKDHQYKRKLLFVVLNENDQKYYPDTNKRSAAAKVYGSELNRLAYVRFWKEKYEQLESEIRLINDPEATNRSSLALHEIGKIYRNDISEFLSFLSTYNGKSFEELYSNKFADLIDWIFRN